jgi:hypothetical protein
MLVALALCCFRAEAQAEGIDFITGNQLYEFCQGNRAYCTGYVAGVAAGSEKQGTTFCLASGVRSDQLGDVVKLWLRDHPEKRHLAASFLVFQALKEKFPCGE